jgi:hypothetical protein
MPLHACLARLWFLSAETIDGLFSNPSSKPPRLSAKPFAENQCFPATGLENPKRAEND